MLRELRGILIESPSQETQKVRHVLSSAGEESGGSTDLGTCPRDAAGRG